MDIPGAKALVADVALDFIKQLRLKDPVQYARPQVALIEKQTSKLHDAQSVKEAARELLAKRGEAFRSQSKGHARTAILDSTGRERTAGESGEALPPADSPLTKVFLGEYLVRLVQETVAYLKMPHQQIAKVLSIPEDTLRDALQGKTGLIRGQWVKVVELLGLATNFVLRPGERDSVPCWELCYPPIARNHITFSLESNPKW